LSQDNLQTVTAIAIACLVSITSNYFYVSLLTLHGTYDLMRHWSYMYLEISYLTL